ncbi:MAG: hypothetical protein EOO11_13625 [Chitinophagaceae bacterium]|nr:MAG: hypothetical protein EOO11_13625 [Chitinophagaceae bacterium]
MTHHPFELDTLKRLYREESKKLLQATLRGAPQEHLSAQRLLLSQVLQRLNAAVPAAGAYHPGPGR